MLRQVLQRVLQLLLQPALLIPERLKVFSLGLLVIRCELLASLPFFAEDQQVPGCFLRASLLPLALLELGGGDPASRLGRRQ